MVENTAQQQLQCGFWFIPLTTIRPFNVSMTNKHRRGHTQTAIQLIDMEGKITPYVRVVISPWWLTHASLKLFLCLIYRAASRFLITCNAGLALKTHPCPWAVHEVHRRIGHKQNVCSSCSVSVCVSSTHYIMNWKMRREQFNKYSFDLTGKMST